MLKPLARLYMRVLILLYTCPHTTIYVSLYYLRFAQRQVRQDAQAAREPRDLGAAGASVLVPLY
jgi:hypothetical protein